MKSQPLCVRSLKSSWTTLTCYNNRSSTGWFTAILLAATVAIASSADVSLMVALKGQRFAQKGPTVVALSQSSDTNGEETLAFESFAIGKAADSIVSGTLSVPGGGNVPLERDDPSSSELGYQDETKTLLDLNTVRANGTYTFNLTTQNDGVQNVGVSLTGDVYPNVPQITNYTALQSANHSAAITVQWTAMTGGTTSDFILVSVSEADTGNNVYESGEPGAAGALNGTSLQAVIPADTLLPGRSYEAEVLFIKVVDTNTSYSGATAIAGYYKLVEFEINLNLGLFV